MERFREEGGRLVVKGLMLWMRCGGAVGGVRIGVLVVDGDGVCVVGVGVGVSWVELSRTMGRILCRYSFATVVDG